MPRASIATRRAGDIRDMAAARWPQHRIASVLGVSQSTVSGALAALDIEHFTHSARPSSHPAHPLINLLRRERMGRKISQRSLGKLTGYSGSQISDWEQGRRKASINALDNLAQALGYKLVIRPEGA